VKSFRYLFASLLLINAPIVADLDISYQDISQEQITDSIPDKAQGPFSLEVRYDWINKAKIDKRCHRHQHIKFSDFEVEGSMIVYYDECNDEGVGLGLEYARTIIDMSHNPYIDQHRFNTVSAYVGFSTHRLCDWLWKTKAVMTVDSDRWDFNRYLTLDFLLWGRYQYTSDIGIHIGVLAQTGMKVDWVYPIIGFDWRINNKWKLDMVFPTDVALVYAYSPNLSFAIAGRGFTARFRAGEHNPLPRGIVTYRAAGIEGVATYTPFPGFLASLHAGTTAGGKMTISNRHYEHHHHFRFDPSLYAGGNLEYKF
jgi:hypothetical protein